MSPHENYYNEPKDLSWKIYLERHYVSDKCTMNIASSTHEVSFCFELAASKARLSERLANCSRKCEFPASRGANLNKLTLFSAFSRC